MSERMNKKRGKGRGKKLEKKETAEELDTKLAEIAAKKDKLSGIKNKQRREECCAQLKRDEAKLRRKRKLLERKASETDDEEGSSKKPKPVPRTIENQRLPTDTLVDVNDAEVNFDESNDEFAAFFRGESDAHVLIAVDRHCSTPTRWFAKDLLAIVPHSVIITRTPNGKYTVKRLVALAKRQSFTDVLVIGEREHAPASLTVTHLPDGPTAHFRISNVRTLRETLLLRRMHRSMTQRGGNQRLRRIHLNGERAAAFDAQLAAAYKRLRSSVPELILNNFSTRLGHSVARMFVSLFPPRPDFAAARCVTFHNQRDFIFFRQHAYRFRDAKKRSESNSDEEKDEEEDEDEQHDEEDEERGTSSKNAQNCRVTLNEVGPRFTLRLRWLQKGTFDPAGEFEWVYKRHEMEANRRLFQL